MIEKTILTEWFTTNQNYEKAYEDFPTKRTWNKKKLNGIKENMVSKLVVYIMKSSFHVENFTHECY